MNPPKPKIDPCTVEILKILKGKSIAGAEKILREAQYLAAYCCKMDFSSLDDARSIHESIHGPDMGRNSACAITSPFG